MQLVQSEKLAAIGELVAGVAHELNNPLTTISLWAELLHQQSINEQERYDLEKIISESHRAANIVHSLLDFSRQHAPERKPVNINVLLTSTVEMVSFELEKNNIKWVFHLDPQVPITVADPYQIKQVFLNLINNAIQAVASENSSRFLNITSEIGPSKYYNQTDNRENVIRIIFEDNGIGISAKILPRIFDPFFTTKSDGTGLGLSVCHGIISEHGGSIWAESGTEGGARFFIELPIETLSEEEKSSETLPSAFTSRNFSHILIIEDEVSVLEVLQRALMRKGYLVEGTRNGWEGLKYLETQNFDVILCDLHMPGMSGIEFYHEIEKKKPAMVNRLIFTTGDTVSPASQKFLKLTGAALLSKPFELEKLLAVIQQKVTNPQ